MGSLRGHNKRKYRDTIKIYSRNKYSHRPTRLFPVATRAYDLGELWNYFTKEFLFVGRKYYYSAESFPEGRPPWFTGEVLTLVMVQPLVAHLGHAACSPPITSGRVVVPHSMVTMSLTNSTYIMYATNVAHTNITALRNDWVTLYR